MNSTETKYFVQYKFAPLTNLRWRDWDKFGDSTIKQVKKELRNAKETQAIEPAWAKMKFRVIKRKIVTKDKVIKL